MQRAGQGRGTSIVSYLYKKTFYCGAGAASDQRGGCGWSTCARQESQHRGLETAELVRPPRHRLISSPPSAATNGRSTIAGTCQMRGAVLTLGELLPTCREYHAAIIGEELQRCWSGCPAGCSRSARPQACS